MVKRGKQDLINSQKVGNKKLHIQDSLVKYKQKGHLGDLLQVMHSSFVDIDKDLEIQYRKLKDLDEKLKAFNSRITDLERSKENLSLRRIDQRLNQVSDSLNKLGKLKDEVAMIQQDYDNTIKNKIDVMFNNFKKVDQDIVLHQQSISKISERLNNINKNIENITKIKSGGDSEKSLKKIHELENNMQDLRNKLDELTNQKFDKDLPSRLEQLRQKIGKLKVDESFASHVDTIYGNFKNIDEDMQKQKKTIDSVDNRLDVIESNLRDFHPKVENAQIKNLHHKIEIMQEIVDSLQQSMNKDSSVKKAILEELAKQNRKIKEILEYLNQQP